MIEHNLDPGGATLGFFKVEGIQGHSGMYLYEDRLCKPKTLIWELRSGITIVNDIILVPIMTKLPIGNDYLYESWLDMLDKEGMIHFENLKKQKNFYVGLIDGNEELFPYDLPNTLKNLILEVERQIDKLHKWTDDAWLQAREVVYKKYATPQELWDVLSSNPVEQFIYF